jgi:hypothetical protein
MRIVYLSDHPKEMLRAVQAGQRKTQEQARAEYAGNLALHQARIEQLRAVRRDARLGGRWLTWLRAVLTIWTTRPPRLEIVRTWSSDQEHILTAGIAGELRVEVALSRALDDGWLLFRGYRNRGGEIDHLLVGPRGVFAMEGKERNATVHVDGDRWTFDKYDKYGNLVEQGEIRDRGGRSPSMQVNAAADELQRFLRSRRQDIQIHRVVVLTHARSRVGSQRNLTASVTNSTDHLVRMIRDSPTTLDAARAAAIAGLIEDDDRFHRSRTRPRPGGSRD